jgi:hypothetical protein
VLVCGPDGSGKAATVDRVIEHLQRKHRHASRLNSKGGAAQATGSGAQQTQQHKKQTQQPKQQQLPRRSFKVVRLHGLLHQKARRSQVQKQKGCVHSWRVTHACALSLFASSYFYPIKHTFTDFHQMHSKTRG